MPLLKIETSAALSGETTEKVLAEASRIVARILQKPEQYMMVSLSPAAMLFSAQEGPAAFCDLRSIGVLSPERCATLSAELCAFLSTSLGVDPARVYLNFTEVEAERWGWNGTTFG